MLPPVLLALFLCCVQWRYGSGSIYAHLRESLEDLHGRPCAGQVVSVSQKEGKSSLRTPHEKAKRAPPDSGARATVDGGCRGGREGLFGHFAVFCEFFQNPPVFSGVSLRHMIYCTL